MSTTEKWDFHKNLMTLGNGGLLNVLKEDWNISKYRATIGHKINHSFTKTNTKFGHVYHPRFGQIRSIVATKDIQKGEELLVNYGYGLIDSRNLPGWYVEAYEREVGPYPKKHVPKPK